MIIVSYILINASLCCSSTSLSLSFSCVYRTENIYIYFKLLGKEKQKSNETVSSWRRVRQVIKCLCTTFWFFIIAVVSVKPKSCSTLLDNGSPPIIAIFALHVPMR